MPLYKVTITGSKTFFIEAEDEDSALDNEVVSDEMMSSIGEFQWEAHEGSVRELDHKEESQVRLRESELIVDF